MIGYLLGIIKKINEDYLVVFVKTGSDFGIGYKIQVPEKILKKAKEGDSLELFIHHYQTEKTEDLYGFKNLSELNLFEQLIDVSGVGPKASIALLSELKVDELEKAITNSDVETLTTAKGIGKKGAQKIITELAETLPEMGFGKSTPKSEAYDALINLGYNSVEAKAALRMVKGDWDDPERYVKEALKNLG